MRKLLFLLSLIACDTSNSDIEYREEDYDAWYINQNIADIDLQTFAKIVLTCDDIQKTDLAVTYTRYHKPVTGAKTQVIGLGFSFSAEDKLAQCYQNLIISMGGIPF